MYFPFGQLVYRDRRAIVPDPYRPGHTVEGDWDPALTIELEDVFIASSSSTALAGASRAQILTEKSLYCADADVDVRPRDRIRPEGMPFEGGTPFFVNARPEGDQSPFVEWAPVLEIPLELVEG